MVKKHRRAGRFVSTGTAQAMSTGGKEAGVLAWSIAAGYYPSFGSRKTRKKFAFQQQPTIQPSIWAMGLQDREAFVKMLSSFGSMANYAPSSISAGIRSTGSGLLSKAAKYALRGQYVWWNSGAEDVNIDLLAQDMYNMLNLDTGFGSLPTAKKRGEVQLKASEVYNSFLRSFTNFESGSAASKTEQMIEGMIGQGVLSKEQGVELITDAFTEMHTGADNDVPEEDWAYAHSLAEQTGRMGFDKPLDQLGSAEKVDIRMWIEDDDGVLHNITLDASETLAQKEDEAATGKHGWVSQLEIGDPHAGKKDRRTGKHLAWEDAADNVSRIRNQISKHWLDTINEEYNPLIEAIIEFKGVSGNLTGLKAMEQVMGKKGKAKEVAAQKTTPAGTFRPPITSDFFKSPEFQAEVAKGGPDTNPAAAMKAVVDGWSTSTVTTKKEKKIKGVMQFILHSLGLVQASAGHDYYMTQRITRKNAYGDAYYAFVPMSIIQPNDTEFANNPYEFRATGPRSPQMPYTEILSGPNASLAIAIKHGVYNNMQARRHQALVSTHFSAHKAHSDVVEKGTNGVLTSKTDAATMAANKHGFTTTWSPKNMMGFFEKLVEDIIGGMDKNDIEALGERALSGYNKSLSVNGLSSGNTFWGLPYIGFEDNLSRIQGEALTWFNEAVEAQYTGMTRKEMGSAGGRWISPSGRVYEFN